jgi:hypothetical protein
MNLYYKYYTADIIEGGLVKGNIIVRVPFYKSAMQAFSLIKTEQHAILNFRRVD